MWSELRRTLRSFRKNPALPAASIVMLALGIGGNVAVFSILDAVVIAPLPVADQERLWVMWESDPGRERPHLEVSFPDFEAWRQEAASFDEMAVFGSAPNRMTLLGEGAPYAVEVSIVATSFFETLGVSAKHGRMFQPRDGVAGSSNVVVISHAFWSRFLGADPTVVGRDITLDGNLNTDGAERFTILGVAESGFEFPHGAEVWLPAQHSLRNVYRNLPFFDDHKSWFGVFWVVGRLKDGVQPDEASAELAVLANRLADESDRPHESLRVVLTAFVDHFLGPNTRIALSVLQGASLLFLVIACVNVAGLVLVRTLSRGGEIALRLSLGATRSRILGSLLGESAILLGVSAFVSVVLAAGSLRFVERIAHLPRSSTIEVDGMTVALTVAASVALAGLVVLPAYWHTARLTIAPRMELEVVRTTNRLSFERIMVVTQTAIACVLVVGACLVTQSYRNVRAADLGYSPAGVSTFKVLAIESKYPGMQAKVRLYRDIIARIAALPEVQAVGIGYLRPLELGPVGMDAGFRLEGQSGEDASDNPSLNWMAASPGYFSAIGLNLVEGREFTWDDDMTHPPVVVIGKGLAERLWPGESPLGRKILTGGARRDESTNEILWQSVVGVVEDGRYRELESTRLDLYVPLGQSEFDANNVVVRSNLEPLQILARVRSVITGIDRDVPITSFSSLAEVVDGALEYRLLTALLFDIFAAVSVLFAAVGVFGVLSFMVVTRARELGLRLALGAVAMDIVALVLRAGLSSTMVGVGAGLVMAVGLSRFVRTLLFGLESMHWPAYAATVAFLTAIVLVACTVPALRATRIDPLVILRHE